MTTICLIPGDGIGQEVVPAAAEVLKALKPDLQFVEASAGYETFQRTGTPIPDETWRTIEQSDATLFGATTTPPTKVEGYRSTVQQMRKRFDLYANLRPTISLPGAFSRQDINLLIVRENTEDLYSGREHREDNGNTAISERVITRRASERILRLAFEQARTRKARRHLPGKVTIVHKSNILKETDGLFREIGLDIAKAYPDIECNELLVDAMAMRLVKDPEHFDVIVTTNLFGDILSDEAAGLVGGLGVAPAANIGDHAAIFEPVHGSAPDIAGKGIANPIGTILSAAMMLEYLQRQDDARRLRNAVYNTIRRGIRTGDIGGKANTRQVTDAIMGELN
ncbi:MAG: isocitrate/isopropylmalate dehydrogenase family protein [Chloroflexi bacterium]|nr:isocitrate/isopropylmalate dehydrogenase family protein [Chloroflexota bacterium]